MFFEPVHGSRAPKFPFFYGCECKRRSYIRNRWKRRTASHFIAATPANAGQRMNQQTETPAAIRAGAEQGPSAPRERLLRIAEVIAVTGISQTQIYRRVNAGEFPKPVRIFGKSVAWVESEVQSWIGETIRASREAA